MKLFHHFTVFSISEQEKTAFSDAGVEFTAVTRGPGGESAILEIGEDDPRWERVATLLASLEGNDQVPKNYRVQDISMTRPTFRESATASLKGSQIGNLRWLDGYSGETVDELLALEGKYRIDSVVLALDEAIRRKRQRHESQALTDEERIVLAVEALEREVNNGGYDQFFANASREFAATIVDSLQRIGYKKTATITQKAIKALGISELSAEAIDIAMASDDKQRLAKLHRCDEAYYKNAEPIAERLFAFIKANRAGVSP